MIKYNISNALGPKVFYSIDNHLLYQIIQENDDVINNDEFVSLVEEQLKLFLTHNPEVDSPLYYKFNTNSNNTKVLVLLKDDVELEFILGDKEKDFLSSTSSNTIVGKTSVFIFPSDVSYKCDSNSVIGFDLELTKDKKYKKII